MDPSYPPSYPPAPPSEKSKLADKSDALFTMYLDRSDEDDRKITEMWKKECDAILIFTGLFSAALAVLLSISIQGIQPSSQDISAFYLRNIYHLLANTTSSQPIVYPTPSDPPPFSPLKTAVVVNALWFLSLSMSLTGALLAVFIQQWALSYLRITQGRYNSPRERARIRTYHAEGLKELHLYRVTRAVPILIHLSLFLFFSGLPVFLFNVNRTVFNVVVTWLALCIAGYGCITLMPIFCHDSPYYSPLSSSIWWFVTNTLFIIYQLLSNFLRRDSFVLRWYRTHYAESHLRWPSLGAMQKAAAGFALQLRSDIDYRALSWMFRTLNDDDEFEQFFDALPSLCDSEALEDPQRAFIKPNQDMLSRALIGMMDRTLLSDLVPKKVKQRRIIICVKAIDATSLLGPQWTLRRVLFGEWKGFSKSIHFGLFVQSWSWKSISRPVTALYAQHVIAITLASVQERDDNWFRLASGLLNASKSLHRDTFAHDDTILLANAIFIIRRTIETSSALQRHDQSDIIYASSNALEILCRFDIQNTSQEYQHRFCSLWNQLVDAAQNNTHPHVTFLCKMMLKNICGLYVTLHKGTDSSPTAFSTATEDENQDLDDVTSYPRCQVVGHHPSLPAPELQILPHSEVLPLASVTPPTSGERTEPYAPTPRPAWHVPIPAPMGGEGTMPTPSPAVGIPGLAQAQMVQTPGRVLVNAAMRMPSPSLGAGGGAMAPVLKFNGYGEFSGLLYHSPHSVLYEEELYPTALHLFEARKFLDHRPDLADRIRQCERVEDVTAISAELAEFTRRDWGNVALSTMDEVLYLKFRQHGELRTLLLNTYPADLVYVESGDPFWGDGAGSGMNELGKSLKRVRERIRIEGRM